MDYTAGKFWFDVGQWIVTLAIGAYAWLTNRHRATRDEIQTARKEAADGHAAHEQRLTRVEETVKHLPDDEALAKLYELLHGTRMEVSAMRASLAALNDTTKATQRQVAGINEFLLKQASKTNDE